ncbi:Golgin subfamily A member 1 [Bagarius yarrelli]|uniref:Golgin subfamily A member 1 n=1 Tax=Bagarius yarrelli TaxID=175774 RepID=A0A556VVL7_BAGYA|nr:Golgin subfamily A member 1 [Bagarius yarrelli]
MFAKLKKKIAEEAATATPRPGRLPRSYSKESITSEKSLLEARLEQSLSLFQKRDEQDELEGFQMQELAKVKHMLLRKEEQLSQKERELKLRGEELNTARITLTRTQDQLYELVEEQQETQSVNAQLRAHRDKLLSEKEEDDRRISDLEAREEELQQLIQQVSEDFQKVNTHLRRTGHQNEVIQAQSEAKSLQQSMESLKSQHDELKLQHEQHRVKAAVMEEERERLQKKVVSLERRLESNLSQDEHLQELLKEKSLLEQRLEESRGELLEERTNHTTAVSSLDAKNSRLNANISELQTLLRHKDDSSRCYRERTDAQAELSSRQTVSVEIAKALEETRKQREELQQQVSQTSASAQRAEQEVQRLSEQVGVKEVELNNLTEELQMVHSSLSSLQEECEALRTEMEDKNTQIKSLQQEILTHTQSKECDAQDAEVCVSEQNGSVTMGDVDELQKSNKELEQQLSEKNKEGKLNSEVPVPVPVPTPVPGCSQGPVPSTHSSQTKVINSSDLTDTREINFEYLKHVVLKFMSSREAEAYQLIRAVSVLLHFTHEEEDMLKQTLEYKMSWFGSKPTPKGIIRPSISGSPSSWM